MGHPFIHDNHLYINYACLHSPSSESVPVSSLYNTYLSPSLSLSSHQRFISSSSCLLWLFCTSHTLFISASCLHLPSVTETSFQPPHQSLSFHLPSGSSVTFRVQLFHSCRCHLCTFICVTIKHPGKQVQKASLQETKSAYIVISTRMQAPFCQHNHTLAADRW